MKKISTFFSVLLLKIIKKHKVSGLILILIVPIGLLMDIIYIFKEHKDVPLPTMIILHVIAIPAILLILKDKQKTRSVY